jgi:hypothetical protein
MRAQHSASTARTGAARTTTTTTTAARLRRAGRLASGLRRLAQRLADQAVDLEAEIGRTVATLRPGRSSRRGRS